jgi:3-keto-disaccharide hydrolase
MTPSRTVGALLALAYVGTPLTLPAQSDGARTSAYGANQLTAAERASGWKLLFDGTTLSGWRGLGYDSIPTAHWKVESGAIKKIPSGDVPKMADGQPAQGGDLMSIEAFGDFELAWEWKVAPGANSGIKYNVSEQFSLANASNHAALGFEYQILDDSLAEDNKIATHRAGALYDLIAPNEAKARPAGEWNESRLIFRGPHGEHWLNGAKIVDFDLATQRMDSLLALSKYKSIKGFADRRVGHIILQDHGDAVYYRSIKIRVLSR